MTVFIAIAIIAALATSIGFIVGFVAGYNLPRIKEWREAMRGWGSREVMKKELIPCPFCGGEVTKFDIEIDVDEENNHRIVCPNCFACGPIAYDWRVAWNTRAISTANEAGED